MSEIAVPSGPARPAVDQGVSVVSADLLFEVVEASEVVLQILAAAPARRVRAERLEISVDGEQAPRRQIELPADHGARVNVLHCPPGVLAVSYRRASSGVSNSGLIGTAGTLPPLRTRTGTGGTPTCLASSTCARVATAPPITSSDSQWPNWDGIDGSASGPSRHRMDPRAVATVRLQLGARLGRGHAAHGSGEPA